MDAVRREAWLIWREPVYIFGGNHDGIKFAAHVLSTIINRSGSGTLDPYTVFRIRIRI
jgi:hypothetical protein